MRECANCQWVDAADGQGEWVEINGDDVVCCSAQCADEVREQE